MTKKNKENNLKFISIFLIFIYKVFDKMRTFSKKQIRNMILAESKDYIVIEKKDLKLKEDTNSNSYVEPSSNSISSLSSDLSNAKSKNPHDEEFIVNANSYDSNNSNDTVTLDVHGSNPTDASKNFQKMTKNPNVRNMIQKGNVNAKFHINNESLNRLRESSVKFTKKELNNIFK